MFLYSRSCFLPHLYKVMASKHLLGTLRPLKLTTQHLIMVVEVSHKVRFLYCMMDVSQRDCNGIRKCELLSPKCIISSAFLKKVLNKMRIYICLEQSATHSFSPAHLCSLHDPYKWRLHHLTNLLLHEINKLHSTKSRQEKEGLSMGSHCPQKT